MPDVLSSKSARSAAFGLPVWSLLCLCIVGDIAVAADVVIAKDDVGRTRELLAPAGRIAAAGGPAEVLLYTLAPTRLVGWNREPSPAALRFIPEALQPRVIIGQLPEARDASRDADFLALAPDLILDYGTVDPDYIERADAIEARLHVPYLLFDGALGRIPDAYRRIGPLVGEEARGTQLATLAQRLLDKYRNLLARSPSRRVYVTDSADGLSPVFTDLPAAEIFAWLGLENVAGRLDDAKTLPITFAQVQQWQPDVIFALNPALRAQAGPDTPWQGLKAVRDGKVYSAPRLPFDWIARPPSVNRLLGLIWVAMVLSPADQRSGFEQDLRELFGTLLHRELDSGELEALLGDG
jgi:iron complex transport system substrate-binding protein